MILAISLAVDLDVATASDFYHASAFLPIVLSSGGVTI